jgi:hypothetical protein
MLDFRRWGLRLATGQKVGVSRGASGDSDGIYIVVSGPDPKALRRLLRRFERSSGKPVRRRRRAGHDPITDLYGLTDKQVERVPGYCYHGTSRSRLRSIARKGLVPREPGPQGRAEYGSSA